MASPSTPDESEPPAAHAAQVYRPIVCPSCGNERPRVRTVRRWVRYYECAPCDLRFKVAVARGKP